MKYFVRIPGLLFWTALASVLASAPLPAQVRKKIPKPEISRECIVDKEGLRQWKPIKEKCPLCHGGKKRDCAYCAEAENLAKCPVCKNKKKAPCQVCTGTGRMFDPLEEMICPYCQAIGWYPCGLCRGRGSYPVEGGGKNEQKCGGCKAVGAFKCTVCRGKLHIPTIDVGKKGPGSADVTDLRKARENLAETLKAIEEFRVSSNESKTFDPLCKIVSHSAKYLPALRDMQKLMEESLKALRKGASYQGYNEWVLVQFMNFQDRSIYLLRHQILLLDICLERAEFNEKVLAAAKDK